MIVEVLNKAFKKVMPLKVFKAHYIRDFYTPAQLADFRDAFNIDQLSLDIALMKRSLLNRIVTQKYYAIFFPKEFPNRFRKKKRKYLRRKPKRRNYFRHRTDPAAYIRRLRS